MYNGTKAWVKINGDDASLMEGQADTKILNVGDTLDFEVDPTSSYKIASYSYAKDVHLFVYDPYDIGNDKAYTTKVLDVTGNGKKNSPYCLRLEVTYVYK